VSAVPKEPGSWFVQSYDKLILLIMLILLLASSVYLLMKIRAEKSALVAGASEQRVDQPISNDPIDIGPYRSNLIASANVFIGRTRTSNRLLVSEERVRCIWEECGNPIPYYAETCAWCGRPQPSVKNLSLDRDGDGIEDEIEVKFGLDPFNVNDAIQDLDGDGFSNVEEHEFGSDMSDPKQAPPPGKKLRIAKVIRLPLNLLFKGILEKHDGIAFQINSVESGRSYFKGVGEIVEGYVIRSSSPDAPAGPTLILQKGNAHLPLVRGKARKTEEWRVILISLLHGERFPSQMNVMLRVNDEIYVRGYTYKVVDINRSEVLIQDTDSGKAVTVSLLLSAELIDLRKRLGQLQSSPVKSPNRDGPSF